MEEKNFCTTLKEGNRYELIIRIMFVEIHKAKVTNRSYDKEFQKKDIDFQFCRNGKRVRTAEVKADFKMWNTGNVPIEMSMLRSSGPCDGWYHYCEAEILCFVDTVNQIAYYLNWKPLKELVTQENWPTRNFNNKTDKCRGVVCLAPLEELKLKGIVKHEEKIPPYLLRMSDIELQEYELQLIEQETINNEEKVA